MVRKAPSGEQKVRRGWSIPCGRFTIFTREPETTTTIDTGDVFQTRDRQPHRVVNASDHEVSVLLVQGVGRYDFRPLSRPQ